MYKSIQKGFTLIELLVVIAIIGILAAVVLVAINPAERINEANDSKVKSDLGQVATAVETCYTSTGGGTTYATSCQSIGDSTSGLVGGGFLKQAPGSTITPIVVSSGADLIYYGTLASQSAKAAFSTKCSGDVYIAYYTSLGQTWYKCGAAPAAADAPTEGTTFHLPK